MVGEALVASEVASKAIAYLDAPIKHIATPDVPIPYAPVLEKSVIPGPDKIRKAILDLVRPS